MKSYVYAAAIWLGLVGCQTSSDATSSDKAQRIIEQAIATHGGAALGSARISFDFREKHYEAQLDQGKYIYESTGRDSTGALLHDMLINDRFARTVNGQPVTLSSEDQQRYGNSLNSVVYFVLLPNPLNDPAVVKNYVGETTLRGEPYHKIRVTFRQEGGGSDFEDEYIYWIHQDRHTVDYLAYSFEVSGGGTRFREAYNTRVINGVRFSDYINYESTVGEFALEDYDQLFEAGQVKELSRIDTENVEVRKPDI